MKVYYHFGRHIKISEVNDREIFNEIACENKQMCNNGEICSVSYILLVNFFLA